MRTRSLMIRTIYRFFVIKTITTHTTAFTKPTYCNAITLFKSNDIRTDFINHSCNFVTRDSREASTKGVVLRNDIRVTYSTRMDFDSNFAVLGRWISANGKSANHGEIKPDQGHHPKLKLNVKNYAHQELNKLHLFKY